MVCLPLERERAVTWANASRQENILDRVAKRNSICHFWVNFVCRELISSLHNKPVTWYGQARRKRWAKPKFDYYLFPCGAPSCSNLVQAGSPAAKTVTTEERRVGAKDICRLSGMAQKIQEIFKYISTDLERIQSFQSPLNSEFVLFETVFLPTCELISDPLSGAAAGYSGGYIGPFFYVPTRKTPFLTSLFSFTTSPNIQIASHFPPFHPNWCPISLSSL